MKLSLLVSIFLNVSAISSSVGSFPNSNLQRYSMNSRASPIDNCPSLFVSYFAKAASTFCLMKSFSLRSTFGFYCERFCSILLSSDRSFAIDFISNWHDALSMLHSFLSSSPLDFYMNVSTLFLNASAFLSCISILILSCFALPIHSPFLSTGV